MGPPILLEERGFGVKEYGRLTESLREVLASRFALHRNPNQVGILAREIERKNIAKHLSAAQKAYDGLPSNLRKVVNEFYRKLGS